MAQNHNGLMLANKQWYKSTSEGRMNSFVGVLAWLTLLPIVFVPFYPLFLKADKSWDRIPALLLHTIKSDPGDVLLLVALIGYLILLPIYQRRAATLERLVLNNEGLQDCSSASSRTGPWPGAR